MNDEGSEGQLQVKFEDNFVAKGRKDDLLFMSMPRKEKKACVSGCLGISVQHVCVYKDTQTVTQEEFDRL